jgi:hypothetical protein
MTEPELDALVERLREGRTNGTALRWTVTPIHLEAAQAIAELRAQLAAKEAEIADMHQAAYNDGLASEIAASWHS